MKYYFFCLDERAGFNYISENINNITTNIVLVILGTISFLYSLFLVKIEKKSKTKDKGE